MHSSSVLSLKSCTLYLFKADGPKKVTVSIYDNDFPHRGKVTYASYIGTQLLTLPVHINFKLVLFLLCFYFVNSHFNVRSLLFHMLK